MIRQLLFVYHQLHKHLRVIRSLFVVVVAASTLLLRCWSCCHPCLPRLISRLGILDDDDDDTCCCFTLAACSAPLPLLLPFVIIGYGAVDDHRLAMLALHDDGLLLLAVSTCRRRALSCSKPRAEAVPCCVLPLLHPCVDTIQNG
jgi:hypothetical protein